MTPEERRTFCRIVGTLLLSDLKLYDSEMAYLDKLYDRLGVDEDEQQAIQASINLRDDVRALATTLPHDVREELFEELKEAAMVDGAMAETEATIIVAVEKALSADDDDDDE